MLWKKTWSPEAVLLLLGGIVLAFFSSSLAAELLHQTGAAGFKTPVSAGNSARESSAVCAATFCPARRNCHAPRLAVSATPSKVASRITAARPEWLNAMAGHAADNPRA